MVLTYAFLCQWAQDVASCLLALEPNSGANVGLLFEHDLETKVSKYAVLRAGKTYIPLDGAMPLKQLIRLCDRNAISCVITHSPHIDMVEKLSGLVRHSFLVINLDHLHPAIYMEREREFLIPAETPAIAVIPDWGNPRLYGFGQSGLMANMYNFEPVNSSAAINPEFSFSTLGGTGMESLETQVNASIFMEDMENPSSVRDMLAGMWLEVLPEMDNAGNSIPVHGEEMREYYPVCPVQRRLFLQEKTGDQGSLSNLSLTVKMNISAGPRQIKRLESVFNALIRRHEILRTSFHLVRGEPVQKVHETVEFTINRVNPSDRQNSCRPFDLSRAPLLRVSMAPLSMKKSMLIIQMHQIAGDRTSLDILLDDLTELWSSGQMEPLAFQYKDYVVWQERMNKDGLFDSQLRYWKNVFPQSEQIPVLNLPFESTESTESTERTHTFDTTRETGYFDFLLDEQEARSFFQLGWFCDVSLHINVLTAFTVLLSRWSGQSDIVVGTAVKGRNQVNPEPVMGPFENLLPLRSQPEPYKTYRDFLTETAVECVRAFENQAIPFERLFELLDPSRDAPRRALFDVILLVGNLEDAYVQDVFDLSPCRETLFSPSLPEGLTSRFNLVLQAVKTEEELHFRLKYPAALIGKDTLLRFSGDLLNIIRKVGVDPDTSISSLTSCKL